MVLPEPADKYEISDLHSDLQKSKWSPLHKDDCPAANNMDTSSQNRRSQKEYYDSAPKERNGETTEDKEYDLKVSFATSQLVSGKVISVSTEMQTNRVSQGYPVLLCKDLGMIFHSLPV